MSRIPHEANNVPDAVFGTGDDHYPPRSAQNQTLEGVSNFVDGSGPIFSMYLEMATEEDKKMAENWKADADGILIFTGLFSAAVASLISVSIQDIRPNPQDTSNFYLENIYRTAADPNRSNILPSSPPPFSPPTYAVWVNSLWFLSLVISLTCALLATLLQQWARRYLKVTQSRYSPHKRARIRAFFAEGVEKFLLPWAVETLPALLHISLFLFFAGLVVFLSNVNITIFKLVLSWVCVCTALYGFITFMPIFRHDSPYYTSLSSAVWSIVIGMSWVIYQVLFFVNWSVRHRRPVFRSGGRFRKLLSQGLQKTAEETALKSRSGIDTRTFMWTFDCLDEDHELERFFSGLPGFRSSKVINDPLPSLTIQQKWDLSTTLAGLLDRTFSSNLLPEPVKKRRAIICAKSIDPQHTPQAFDLFDYILSNYQNSGPLHTEILQIVRGWSDNERAALVAQATVCSTVARAKQRDDPWFILASNQLGVPESVLRVDAAHGDDLSLAILIHVIRQQLDHFWEPSWRPAKFSRVLEAATKFNVQDTSPKLQHEFCALWNQIVLKAQNGNRDRLMAPLILKRVRNVYIALHQDPDSALTRFSTTFIGGHKNIYDTTSYPMCNVVGHIHDDSASTTFARTDDAGLVPASLSSPDTPSLSVHVVEDLTDVPPLENLHPVYQTTIQSLPTPVTSPDPATAGPVRDIVSSGTTILHFTPETSTSTPPLSPAVVYQHDADLLIPSDAPNLPSSASFKPFLDNILPTGPPQFSQLPMTIVSDLSPSCPESHPSIMATTALSTSTRPISAPDLAAAAAEDDGGPMPGLCKEQDTLDPPSVNHAIRAQQSPSLSPATNRT